MANFSNDERKLAVATMSSLPDQFSKNEKGKPKTEDLWSTFRGRVARAIAADPDVIFYWAFLGSNRARKQALDLAQFLREMIAATEGIALSAPIPDLTPVVTAHHALHIKITKQGDLDAGLQQLNTAVGKSVQTLLPAVAQGKRRMAKGEEASSDYQTAEAALLADWDRFLSLLLRCTLSPIVSQASVRAEAVKVPSENLKRLVDSGYQPAQGSAYALQLLAGHAAVQAMGRPFDPHLRLRLEKDSIYPEGAKLLATGTAGVITSFTTSPSPMELGIKPGDLVTWFTGSATVDTVGESATLRDSTVPLGAPRGRLEVHSGVGSAYKEMRKPLLVLHTRLPTATELREGLAKRTHTADRMEYLAGVLGLLTEIEGSTESALSRQGIDIEPELETVAGILLAYSPTFREETRDAGKSALTAAKSGGFDRAADLLIELHLDHFLQLGPPDATYAGRMGTALAGLTAITAQTFTPATIGIQRGR